MGRRKDYYTILGLQRGASDAEVKSAYRRMARRFHPDVTGDDPQLTERFKEMTEAYEVLSDPLRRRTYDLFGQADSSTSTIEVPSLADLLAEIWPRRRKRVATPGTDIDVVVDVSFTESYVGCARPVEVRAARRCTACSGTGHEPGAQARVCPSCQGTGKRHGALAGILACRDCAGEGTQAPRACRACAGDGTTEQTQTLRVTVPPGVDDGTRLRLRGQGHAGRHGGAPGDLYAVVTIVPDPQFERDGQNLRIVARVPFTLALAGGELDVALPDGTARVRVPPGTQGGQVLRLRGRGFPALNEGGSGDALVTIQIRVPRQADAATQRAIGELIGRIPDG